MKVVIATPLYPPDIADPAPYVKELTTRLVNAGHTVTVVIYGRLPETVPGARIIAIDKRHSAPWRLLRFTTELIHAFVKTDMVYLQSGVSAELPALIALLFARPRILLRVSKEPGNPNLLRRVVRTLVQGRATTVETSPELVRPEILPLAPYPEEAMVAFRRAWESHVTTITSI